MHKVIVEDGGQRQHRQWLRKLLETTNGPVRVASAYVTDRDLLFGAKKPKGPASHVPPANGRYFRSYLAGSIEIAYRNRRTVPLLA